MAALPPDGPDGPEFDALIAELSTNFIALPHDQVDGAILDAQRRVCECVGLDGSVLFQGSADAPDLISATHVHPPERALQLPVPIVVREYFPWCTQQLTAGKTVVLSSIEGLPPEAARDQAVWREYGTKSVVVFPLAVGGSPVTGLLTFNTTHHERAWPEALVSRLRLVAQIIGNALVRKVAESKLRTSEARLANAIGIAGLGFYEAAEDGRITFMDQRTRELFAIPPGTGERVRELWLERIHPADRERVLERARVTLRGGDDLASIQYRYLHPERGEVWIDHLSRVISRNAAGAATRLFGVIEDITESKTVEMELRDLVDRFEMIESQHQEALEFNRVIMTSLLDSIMILDREGRIIAANDAWAQYAVEYDSPNVHGEVGVGADFLQLCRRKKDRRAMEGVRAVLNGSSQLYRVEYTSSAAPESGWYMMEAMPLRRTSGGAVVVHRDITALKKAEEELVQLRKDVWHAHRVAQTGAIAASLAHELNQPLAAILSNAQAGLRMMAGPDLDLGEIREILADIVRDDKRAAAVIVGLRAMLRRKETQRESVDLRRAIQTVLGLTRSELIAHDIQVELQMLPDCVVSVDMAQIQQVFLNLVMNAVEAMEDEPAGLRRLDIAMSRDDAGQVLVGFRDSGRGIPEEGREKVFEPFWTTKEHGMGIGLPICRTIIETQGGHLWFVNNEDRGVTFFVSLPMIPPRRRAGAAGTQPYA